VIEEDKKYKTPALVNSILQDAWSILREVGFQLILLNFFEFLMMLFRLMDCL
jgi:hypothetical protein